MSDNIGITPDRGFAGLRPDSADETLPPGFEWEYRDGMDGGGSIGYRDGKPYSEHWPSTVYRRAVGPWRIHRQGGRSS